MSLHAHGLCTCFELIISCESHKISFEIKQSCKFHLHFIELVRPNPIDEPCNHLKLFLIFFVVISELLWTLLWKLVFIHMQALHLASLSTDFAGKDDIITNFANERKPGNEIIERASLSLITISFTNKRFLFLFLFYRSPWRPLIRHATDEAGHSCPNNRKRWFNHETVVWFFFSTNQQTCQLACCV